MDAGGVDGLVLGVGDDAEATCVCVLIFVLPSPACEIGFDEQVQGQVEGVEAAVGAGDGVLEVHVPVPQLVG
ncbi:hypothetical protein, partial [Streptomyces yatensis]|uniref:hypothetical protein n=1 Tax=Streptomyces yatensis TaxID=155177 RepID=UPI003CD0C29D